ncbi:MAG: hypothetical protein R3301_08400 [Saprospiraceae bacterium]|nr:hypothetical protein [Saprospiraceae bacterium]
MRRSLRNEHRVAWLVLGPGMLLLLVAVLLAMPRNAIQQASDPPSEHTFTASVGEQDSARVVRLTAGRLPVAASAYVFASDGTQDGARRVRIGQLLQPGEQTFTLPGEAWEWQQLTITLEDVIKDSVLFTMILEQ